MTSRTARLRVALHADRLANLILWLLAALALALFLVNGARVLATPYQLDYGEGPLLAQAASLAQGAPIYRADLSAPPYTIANYPPLFPALQAPLVWLFGPALWIGRGVALLGALLAALSLVALVWRVTANRLAAAVSGTTLLLLPAFAQWAGLGRVDTLALGLSLAGLAVIVWRGERRGGLVTAGALLLLAIATRQTYALAAPLAACVWIGWGSWRRGLWFGLGLAATTLALAAGLNALTGGGLLLNLVTANVNPFSPAEVVRQFSALLKRTPLLWLSGALYLALGRRTRGQVWWFTAAYASSALVSATTIGKVGSNVNYLLELCAALALLAGLAVHAVAARPRLRAALLLALAAQLALLLAISGNRTLRSHSAVNPGELAQLHALVANAPGPVLLDEQMALLPQTGRPILYQPFEVKQLADSGAWDERAFVGQLERREYALIGVWTPAYWPEVRETRWTPAQLSAIERNYRVVTNLVGMRVYVPKP